MITPIDNISKDQVGKIVQNLIDHDEVEQLTVAEQPDGTFTVTPIG